MARTIWLASYPKSGNTWFRFFMGHLLYPEVSAENFSPLSTPLASNRHYFNELLGISSALLTHDEIDVLRAEADRELNKTWSDSLLIRKVHDAFSRLPDGRPILGGGENCAAIYILRHPWDMAPSLANHMGYSLDEAVDSLLQSKTVLAGSTQNLNNQLRQILLAWDEHVLSWLSAPFPVHVMRYEDMRNNPLPIFREALRFLDLHYDDSAISSALEACRFERLQERERKLRFKETPRHAGQFFRSARVGEGLEKLKPERLARLQAMQARVEAILASREALV